MITIRIPTQLRAAAGGRAEAEVQGATVREALQALWSRHEGLEQRIASEGELRRFVNVYVGGEDVRFLEGLETPLTDGDEVTILPAVAGGLPSAGRAAAAGRSRRPRPGRGPAPRPGSRRAPPCSRSRNARRP